MSGVYTYLPLGLKVIKKIENIIRDKMNENGGQELFMPALHPVENYLKTGRENIDVLYYLNNEKDKKILLGQSHEEIIVPLVKQYIQSRKDLPIYLYQIQTKFRNELRAKSGILRSREFLMKDLYSFHLDEKDFENYYAKMQQAYQDIFRLAGIGHDTFLTYASGGSFSQYSHEFQTITDAGEDTIYLCEKCQVAINSEIIDSQKTCPKCHGTKLVKKCAIEVGNIFPLKSKFSDAFELNYTDMNGQKKPIIMGCYGIGLGRLMGAIVEINNDKKGIAWPASVSPFHLHLLNLGKKINQKLLNETIVICEKENIELLFDDRDLSPGVKLNDADLIGISLRGIISEKTGEQIEIKNRLSEKSRLVSLSNLVKIIKETYSVTF
ncbi:MAG: aminoacyl--tRNA ligase-related protein [Patescibacteria group bacterium]